MSVLRVCASVLDRTGERVVILVSMLRCSVGESCVESVSPCACRVVRVTAPVRGGDFDLCASRR
jgi:hypothetical protein